MDAQELPRNQIFASPFEQVFFRLYRRLFSIEEIEASPVLQWVFGASLFSFFLTFNSWIHSSLLTVEAVAKGLHVCWPYFQSCGDWYFLSALPDGYSQTTLYMGLFGLMLLVVYLMWRKDWVLAHILLLILFFWKAVAMFVLSGDISGNYDYYHIILTLILLFIPFKLFFLKLSFVLLYFLAATIKIHEGWILGTYFSALKTGLPLIPDALIPLATNIVMFMQIVGAWFLLSSRMPLQRTALAFFVFFHLYSGILVEYRYPGTVLPTLLILFGSLYTNTPSPWGVRSIAGWILVGLMFVFQSLALLIPGDAKMTLEGNKYGLYMFEANHQCVSERTIEKRDGTVQSFKGEMALARHRCDPYEEWFAIQQRCLRDTEVARIGWTFDHSINGGPFYRIVDEKDACALRYRALGHNEWIRPPEGGAPVVGYPVENIYR